MALTSEFIVDKSDMLSRWVRLPSGVRAHYMTAGHKGEHVLFLHGGLNGGSGQAGWHEVAPGVAQGGFRVHCPDLLAFGLTVDHGDVYGDGLGAQLAFVRDFVDTMGIDKFHIVGNSLGCNIAAHFMVENPERILSFTGIAGAFGDVIPFEKIPAPPKGVAEKVSFDGSEASMRKILENIVLDPSRVSDDVVAARTYAANLHGDKWDRMMKKFFSDVNHTGDGPELVKFRTKGRLDQLTIPAIYVYGAKDTISPVERAYVQEDALPNIQFFYPAHCGHQSQTDDPELHVRLISEFLSNGRVTGETAREAGVSQRRPLLPVVES